jgi:hypothetical protein
MALSKDLLSGLVFVGVGLFLLVEGRSYELGTPLRMGPGYFPMLVGGSLSAVGLGLVVQGLVKGGEPAPRPARKPLLLVTASLVAFAFALSSLGLVLATVILIVLSRLAAPSATLKGTVAITAIMVVTGALVFRTILELPLKLWP